MNYAKCLSFQRELDCFKKNVFLEWFLILFGALAQLVERNNGIVEANGSTPLRSISLFLDMLVE